ncbi:MAG: RNA-binding protein [Akkermansiaceae bacterium]|jgi:RNA recognition motif-containing protein|nr:RNA-binding protein [Akkermansiaceae bacterium]MDP4995405.1 RNA-binding protein [Akkermansiaceae bacterium]
MDDLGQQPFQILQILIRNIDRSLTQPEIVCHFRKYGRVSSCVVVKDEKTGQSKGFGFAEMPNFDEAMKAIEELNGLQLGSSKLRVKKAATSTVAKKEKREPREERREARERRRDSRER